MSRAYASAGKERRRWCAIVALCACLPATAYGNPEAGGFVGILRPSPTGENGRYLDDPPDNSLEPGVYFGIRAAWFWADTLGVEGQLGVLPSRARDHRAASVVTNLSARLVAQWPGNHWRPFVFIGGQAVYIASSNPTWIVPDVGGGTQVGAGVKYLVTERWGIRVDVIGFGTPATPSGYTVDIAGTIGLFGLFPWPSPPPQANDFDGDGVADTHDHCPKVPGIDLLDGCPLPHAATPAQGGRP